MGAASSIVLLTNWSKTLLPDLLSKSMLAILPSKVIVITTTVVKFGSCCRYSGGAQNWCNLLKTDARYWLSRRFELLPAVVTEVWSPVTVDDCVCSLLAGCRGWSNFRSASSAAWASLAFSVRSSSSLIASASLCLFNRAISWLRAWFSAGLIF